MPEDGIPPRPVGRTAERAALTATVVDLATTRRPSAIALIGDGGMGKSTLVAEAVAVAQANGLAIALGKCRHSSVESPLQGVREALGQADQTPLAPTGSVVEAMVSSQTTLLVLNAVDALDRWSANEPVLLVIEDLHWADRATLTLIHHLVSRPARGPLGIIVTSRPPERSSPLTDLLSDGSMTMLRLEAMPVDDLLDVALIHLGAEPDDPRRADLCPVMGSLDGNPMLAEAAADALRSGAGASVSANPITERIARLDAETSDLVGLAAIAGGAINIGVLARAAALSETRVRELLDRAAAVGVVTDVDGRPQIRHDLFRTAIVDSLSVDQADALHRAMASALADTDDLHDSLEVVGHVIAGASRPDQATIDRLVGAAMDLVVSEPAVALSITDSVLDLVGQGFVPTEVLIARTASLAACGRGRDASELGEDLLARQLDPQVEARVRRDLALAAVVVANPSVSVDQMRRAVDVATDSAWRRRASVELGWALFLAMDHEGAEATAASLIDDPDPTTLIGALALRCWTGLWHLDPGVFTLAEKIRQLVEVEMSYDWHVFQPLLGVAAAQTEQLNLDGCLATVAAGRALTRRTGGVWAIPAYDAMEANAAFMLDDLDWCWASAAAAVDGAALVDGFGVELWSRSLLARVALRRGQTEVAEAELATVDVIAADGRAQLGLDHMYLAMAEAAQARGDRDEAAEVLSGGFQLMHAVGVHQVLGQLGAATVEALIDVGRRDEAADIVTTMQHLARSGFPRLVVGAAQAAARLHPGDEGLVAEAAVATSQSRPTVTRPGHPTARTAVPPIATSPSTPERGDGHTSRFNLTKAERRVAMLVADGLTNREIAAELMVSRRTVDSQVLACYRKLNVRSRVELTRHLMVEDLSAPTPGG